MVAVLVGEVRFRVIWVRRERSIIHPEGPIVDQGLWPPDLATIGMLFAVAVFTSTHISLEIGKCGWEGLGVGLGGLTILQMSSSEVGFMIAEGIWMSASLHRFMDSLNSRDVGSMR